MTQNEKDTLMIYIYNKQTNLEQDSRLMLDKYNLRECDEIDYLESIIATTRQKAFNDFAFDIIRLLDLPLDYLIQKWIKSRTVCVCAALFMFLNSPNIRKILS